MRRSPRLAKKIAPNGLVKNPAANTPSVAGSASSRSDDGENRSAMTGASKTYSMNVAPLERGAERAERRAHSPTTLLLPTEL